MTNDRGVASTLQKLYPFRLEYRTPDGFDLPGYVLATSAAEVRQLVASYRRHDNQPAGYMLLHTRQINSTDVLASLARSLLLNNVVQGELA